MTLAGFFKVLPWALCIVLFAGWCLLIWWLRRDTLKRGALQAINEGQKETLDDLDKANAARDRLRSDPAYADRVRDRYSRD